jgi:hypothetical protein
MSKPMRTDSSSLANSMGVMFVGLLVATAYVHPLGFCITFVSPFQQTLGRCAPWLRFPPAIIPDQSTRAVSCAQMVTYAKTSREDPALLRLFVRGHIYKASPTLILCLQVAAVWLVDTASLVLFCVSREATVSLDQFLICRLHELSLLLPHHSFQQHCISARDTHVSCQVSSSDLSLRPLRRSLPVSTFRARTSGRLTLTCRYLCPFSKQPAHSSKGAHQAMPH